MKTHTIIMLVGSIASGKSTLASRIDEELFNSGYSVEVLSSDGIRQELVGDHCADNLNAEMQAVSQQAFAIFNAKLEALISYPVNKEFVILDTTGLAEEYRNHVLDVAKKHHYNVEMVLLNVPYKDLKIQSEGRDSSTFESMRSQKRLREDVMPNLNRKAYSKIHIIKSIEALNNFASEIEIEDQGITGYMLSDGKEKIAVIGDVHECVEELRELMGKLIEEGVQEFFLIGDLLDKGGNTAGMVEFIRGLDVEHDHYRGAHVTCIRGNHERYVYKALKGEIEKNEVLENDYFTSIAHFRAIEEDKNLFLKFYEQNMQDCFVIDRGRERGIVLTHAPCENKYLLKNDTVSKKNQNNFYFKSREEDVMIDELKFLEAESSFNHFFHVFGHVAHTGYKPHRIKNKIFLDTGCVHGGRLSAVVFNKHYVDFVSVDHKNRSSKGSMIKLVKEQTALERLSDKVIRLDDDQERALKRILKGGARYISGTMVPAPSTETDIESLEEALKLFAHNDKVQLQPKYMGSRAQAYLHEDRSLNFAVSRNGFRINIPGIEVALGALQDEVSQNLQFESIVIDAELLPWAALGKGLIDSSFKQYETCISTVYGELSMDEAFLKFGIYSKEVLEEKNKQIAGFSRQIELYGQAGDPYFKAFDILEIDGQPFESRHEAFALVNSASTHIVDFSDPDHLVKAYEFFNALTYEQGFEGVVVKPDKYNPGKAPYMKVRNKEYLRIVYGFDYDNADRLKALCRQKSIKGKSRLAVKEYELGMAMLTVGSDLTLKKKIIAEMMGCMAEEKTLDPRL